MHIMTEPKVRSVTSPARLNLLRLINHHECTESEVGFTSALDSGPAYKVLLYESSYETHMSKATKSHVQSSSRSSLLFVAHCA